MNKRKLFALLALAGLIVTGCQQIVYTTNPGRGIFAGTLSTPVTGTLEAHRKAHFMFWGLARVGVPDIENVVARQMPSGQALASIQITEKNTFLDGLLAALTYGIYRPRTVYVTGQLHQLEGAAK